MMWSSPFSPFKAWILLTSKRCHRSSDKPPLGPVKQAARTLVTPANRAWKGKPAVGADSARKAFLGVLILHFLQGHLLLCHHPNVSSFSPPSPEARQTHAAASSANVESEVVHKVSILVEGRSGKRLFWNCSIRAKAKSMLIECKTCARLGWF